MVVVAMVTDLTIVTATIPLVDHIMVVDNHPLMDRVTTHTDTNLTQRGVLVVMEPERVTEVQEDVKVL